MKKILNNVFVAFMSGLLSSLILIFLFAIARQHGVHSIVLDDDFKYNLYRLMVWGGVWAMLFAVPFPRNILIKVVLVGASVILFNSLVLMPLNGQGYFGLDAGTEVIKMNIIFNSIWALVAGFMYRIAVITEF